MIFIESSIFRKYLAAYFAEDEFRALQLYLVDNPKSGQLIRGSGGLRKLRWGVSGKGKSSGVRIIYSWQAAENQIYLLTLYAKNEVADLSPTEISALKKMVEAWSQ